MIPDMNSIILYEDAQIIVCHKPAGLAVQSARIGSQDLESLLKNHISETLRTSGHSGHSPGRRQSPAPYLAVIHRLDQPVEGLLVFAKTPGAAKELNRQLTAAGFGKYYRALVSGIPDPSEGTLEDYLVKDARTNASRVCTKNTPGAKAARLHYRTEKIYQDTSPVTSLVEIHLDTGRHHQIRVQMAHLGCPLVGDRKYGAVQSCRTTPGKDIPPASTPPASQTPEGPLRLCAYRLEFRHPVSGEKMTFMLEENPW